MHTLFDVETQVPAFIHITNAMPHDIATMDVIPYEPGSYYVFDKVYNHYKCLYCIHFVDSFLVVRAKKNVTYRTVKWARRMPKNILSDAQIELTDYYPSKHYPETLRLVRYRDEENKREFTYLTNAKHLTAQQVADMYKSRWQVEFFFKWFSNIFESNDSGGQAKIPFKSSLCSDYYLLFGRHYATRYEVESLNLRGSTDTQIVADRYDTTR